MMVEEALSPEKKQRNNRSKRESHDVDSWMRAIDKQIRSLLKEGSYGTLRIEFYGGEIRRCVQEKSAIHPETLASSKRGS